LFDPTVIAILLAVVGIGAGTLGSMLGVGGGIIMVPVLTFLGIYSGICQAAANRLQGGVLDGRNGGARRCDRGADIC
jgi:uncharacterized membrane protein YfcA